MIRRLLRTASVCVLVSGCCVPSMLAYAATTTYKVVLRTRWKVDDVITRTSKVARSTVIEKLVAGLPTPDPMLTGISKMETTYEAVQKCLEADADGNPGKFRIQFSSFAMTPEGGASDTSLKDVQVEIAGSGPTCVVKILTPNAAPSAAAMTWLDSTFGSGERGTAVLAVLEPGVDQAIGGSWSAAGKDVVKALADPTTTFDETKTTASGVLKSITGTEATTQLDLSLVSSGLPMGGGLVWKWKGSGATGVTITLVRGVDADAHDGSLQRSTSFDDSAIGPDFELHLALVEAEATSWKAGGTLPDVSTIR